MKFKGLLMSIAVANGNVQIDQMNTRRSVNFLFVICITPKYRSMLIAETNDSDKILYNLNNFDCKYLIQQFGISINS